MSEQSAYPLSWPVGWPRTKSPTYSPFGKRDSGERRTLRKVPLDFAKRELRDELSRLGATNIVVSTNQQLRRDGEIRQDRSDPVDKGVAVYFTLKGQKRVLACDKWDRIADNIHAIAKTIDATRGIERWGSVTTEQAFAGYAALPEKTQLSCWEVLGLDPLSKADNPLTQANREASIIRAWRDKVKMTHPQNGGTAESFAAVNAAKDMALQLVRQ